MLTSYENEVAENIKLEKKRAKDGVKINGQLI
jgi:hypothetical protein